MLTWIMLHTLIYYAHPPRIPTVYRDEISDDSTRPQITLSVCPFVTERKHWYASVTSSHYSSANDRQAGLPSAVLSAFLNV